MTTLRGEQLFEYFNNLENILNKGEPPEEQGRLLHHQLCTIANMERELANYYRKNGIEGQISIASNGLPTVESLKADLDSMANLADANETFKLVSEEYKRGMSLDTMTLDGKIIRYDTATKEEWMAVLEEYNHQLHFEIGFDIYQTEDGKLGLNAREMKYAIGYDEGCNYPVLMREAKGTYWVFQNKLRTSFTEQHYMPEIIMCKNIVKNEDGQIDVSQKVKAIETRREKLITEREIFMSQGEKVPDYLQQKICMETIILELQKNNQGSDFKFSSAWDVENWFYVYNSRFKIGYGMAVRISPEIEKDTINITVKKKWVDLIPQIKELQNADELKKYKISIGI